MNKSDLSSSMKKSLGKNYLRLLDQSFKFNSHHLGSAFSALPIVLEIYAEKQKEDVFILSSGHAAAALYVVLEQEAKRDSSELFEKMGEHPHRDKSWDIYCTTGSLGMGIAVATGVAIADREKNVYCLVSDGECSEGVFWESIRFIKQNKLTNLYVYVNINGWAGYDKINSKELADEITSMNNLIKIRKTNNYPFEEFGLAAHYMNLNQELYKKLREKICEDFL
jgi:transketolase